MNPSKYSFRLKRLTVLAFLLSLSFVPRLSVNRHSGAIIKPKPTTKGIMVND
jgi:hypothetical protein